MFFGLLSLLFILLVGKSNVDRQTSVRGGDVVKGISIEDYLLYPLIIRSCKF